MQDFIVNPKTGRPVKIGSRLYNSLMFKGIIGLENAEKKTLKTKFKLIGEEESDEEEIKGPPKSKLAKNDWISAIAVLVYRIVNDDLEVDRMQKMDFKEVKEYVSAKIIAATKLNC
jgi:hypothetical protein